MLLCNILSYLVFIPIEEFGQLQLSCSFLLYFPFLGMKITESVSDEEEAGPPYLEFQNIFDAAYYIDDFLYICDLISVTIGIPLNLVVIGAILLLKRLHLQRNFTWIGIGTSNIIILTSHLMVDLSVRLGSSASVRALSIWFVALSRATQTINISFSHLERYMCINHPKWHRTLFTTTSIVVVQLSSFILLFLVLGLTNIPLFQELFLNRLFSSWGFKLVGTLFIGLLPMCLAGQIAVMTTQTRKDNPDSVEKQNDGKKIKSSSHFVVVGNNRVSRQDFNAAQHTFFMSNVYILFQTLKFISFALVIGCVIRTYSSIEEIYNGSCASVVQGFYYTSGISSVFYSVILDPVAFVTLSSDLLVCLKSRSRRKSAVARELEKYEMTQM